MTIRFEILGVDEPPKINFNNMLSKDDASWIMNKSNTIKALL